MRFRPAHGVVIERRLNRANRRDGGRIAAAVFSDDGLFRLLFPDDGLRRGGVARLHRGLLAAIPRTTTVSSISLGGKLAGCSLWVPPLAWPYPRSFYVRSQIQSARLIRSHAMNNQAALAFIAEVSSHHEQGPHFYLQLLMVDPAHQRRGFGDQLLAPGLAAADREGVPCVLETQAERNLAYYARHGFAVTAVTTDPTNTATMWTMVRQPR